MTAHSSLWTPVYTTTGMADTALSGPCDGIYMCVHPCCVGGYLMYLPAGTSICMYTQHGWRMRWLRRANNTLRRPRSAFVYSNIQVYTPGNWRMLTYVGRCEPPDTGVQPLQGSGCQLATALVRHCYTGVQSTKPADSILCWSIRACTDITG
jgi:hypothetical protein